MATIWESSAPEVIAIRPLLSFLLLSSSVTLGPGRYRRRLDWSWDRPKSCSLGVQASRRTLEVRRFSEERQLNSMTETKRDPRQGAMTLVYSKGVSSRSKLEIWYRKYDGLYRKGGARTDHVAPALIRGMRKRRMGKNMMESMSKRNYVISAREPIGGDRSPRQCGNRSDEYPFR